ncbi:hypothetical protein Pmani_021259 [Petrolisthes manimaculis]|uniref:Uncharacterized protein n=1 Tax=Petrolisthes manimaculis TaxID=1843537 RepID=A0AAE1U3E6_9EUCA|nr:hypothetical protein Pmani_021259 [Petrolisthes manimaculis]
MDSSVRDTYMEERNVSRHSTPKENVMVYVCVSTSGVAQASELPSTMELYPSLAIIMGVVGGILVVFVVIVVVMVVRRPRRENLQARLHQDDSSMHILKKDDSHSGRLDVDEKDPDVIPDTRVVCRDLVEAIRSLR